MSICNHIRQILARAVAAAALAADAVASVARVPDWSRLLVNASSVSTTTARELHARGKNYLSDDGVAHRYAPERSESAQSISRSSRASSRSMVRLPPLLGAARNGALPVPVRGPVDFSHGVRR